jgi:nucleoside-diphosphate-sugar epimerase
VSEDRLHVVFGSGQVGSALAAHLSGKGLTVRSVSRHRSPNEVDWRAATRLTPTRHRGGQRRIGHLPVPERAVHGLAGALPAAAARRAHAAERNGALLVSLENLYAYGPTAGRPMTEDLPLAATTVKGRTRAAMTEELLAAARPAGSASRSGGRRTSSAPASPSRNDSASACSPTPWPGKRADFIGNPDLPHTYSYVPDIAAGLATLGTDERAVGGVWHLPGPETVTTRELLELIAGEVGHPVAVRSVPKLAVRALGLFNPMMRELAEMAYEFEEPFVLDTTKYQSTFGTGGTPLAAAIAATVAWYRRRGPEADEK